MEFPDHEIDWGNIAILHQENYEIKPELMEIIYIRMNKITGLFHGKIQMNFSLMKAERHVFAGQKLSLLKFEQCSFKFRAHS